MSDPGRGRGGAAVVQRVLPNYRVPFFDLLSERLGGGLEIFAGSPRPEEGIRTGKKPARASLTEAVNVNVGAGRYHVIWQKGIESWLRRVDPDVLIAEANPRMLSNRLAVRYMKSRGRPIIGWGLGALEWSGPSFVKALREKLIERYFRRFDAMIAYSGKGAEDYARFGVARDRIFVAPNSVSRRGAEQALKRMKTNPEVVAKWKDILGLSERPVALYVGRLAPQKRVSDLIRANGLLGGAMDLLIVGDGPEMEKLIAESDKVGGRALFLGHIEGEQLGICFAVADIFVLPGTGGLAVQEAMMYGKPVLTAPGDGTQGDLVRDGENGYVIRPGDVDLLARLMMKMIEDPGAIREMGERSLRIIKEEVNIDKMADAFITAIGAVLKKDG